MWKAFVIAILAVAILFVLMIYFGQDKLIYFPRSYSTYSKDFDQVEFVNYQNQGCRQTSFLYPKREWKDPPRKVWWFFGGNGSLALDWLRILERAELPDDYAFVLVDYPKYGKCQGKPSPHAISTSIDVLHQELAKMWQMRRSELSARSATMGHSLGAAIALATAAEYGMTKTIAISPFTSMQDMAKLKIGWLHGLLDHHYDNREAIRALCDNKSRVPARIFIFHGSRDTLIPVGMAKELAEIAGTDTCQFVEVKGRAHADIVYSIRDDLIRLISE